MPGNGLLVLVTLCFIYSFNCLSFLSAKSTRHEIWNFMSSPDNSKKKSVGRPQRTMADKVRTLAWIRCVLSKSQKSAFQLGKEFHPEQYRYDGEKQRSSKRWERYEEGTSFPPDPDTGDSLIDLVERAYPGTAWVYRHTVWKALGGGISDVKEVTALLLTLGDLVTDICFIPRSVRGKTTLRRVSYDYGLPTKLGYLRSIDGFAALLLLAREAELTGDGKVHAQIYLASAETLFYLRDVPELRAVLSEIVECMNETLCSFTYFWGGDVVAPSPTLSLEAILGDGDHFWRRDESTPLVHELLERLARLFAKSELLEQWLREHHPMLGESPDQALRHPQGIRAIQKLFVG